MGQDTLFKGVHFVNITKDIRVHFGTDDCKILSEDVEGYVHITVNGVLQKIPFRFYYSGDKDLLRIIRDYNKTLNHLQIMITNALGDHFRKCEIGIYQCTTFTPNTFKSVI